MLLAADSNRGDGGRFCAERLHHGGDGVFGCGGPVLGVLFHGARRKVGHEAIGLLGGSEDLAGVQIESDAFGALSAAI